MSSSKCFDLSQVHEQGAGPFWLQFFSSDGEGVTHSPVCFSMKTTSWAGAIRAKLICVARACARVIYSRAAGFGQRLLAWLTGEPTCTTPFAQIGQDYLKSDHCVGNCYTSGNHGSIWANFCSPLKATKLVQISIGLPERASKKCSYWKNSFLHER